MTVQKHSSDPAASQGSCTTAEDSPRAAFAGFLTLRQVSFVVTAVMWPLAIMSFIHKVILTPQNHHVTDDFTTVWEALGRFREGVPVYSENYSLVDPHYLYSPGGTLLLSPLAYFPDFDIARIAYILANGVAMVIALALLTRLFGFTLRGPVWPTAVVLLFATESVKNTLLFSNINGLLLLAEVIFFILILDHPSKRSEILAGVVLGLAITVKPQFLPLLFIPFVRRQLATVLAGLTVPVVFNIAALPFMTAPGDYITKLVPYLGEVRDYANSSIAGVGAYFGAPEWVTLLWRILAAVFVLVALAGLMRWRDRDPVMWATTTAGVLLTGVFLISSLGQMYYSMLLVPMFFTVLRYRSVMHNPVAWFGVYFCMSLDDWHSDRWHTVGRAFEYVRGTLGWSALLIAATVTMVVWTKIETSKGMHILGDVRSGGIFGPRRRVGVDKREKRNHRKAHDEHGPHSAHRAETAGGLPRSQ